MPSGRRCRSLSSLRFYRLQRWPSMGSAASKAQKASRMYPSPSNIPNRSSTIPTQTRTPFPPPSQFTHPANVRAKLEGQGNR
jgi:hypothetical protein